MLLVAPYGGAVNGVTHPDLSIAAPLRFGIIVFMNSLSLFAQAEVEPVRVSMLFWYLDACGPFFGLIFVLMSIVFVTLTIMNWLAISRNAIVPSEMVDQFHEKLDKKEYQEAYELAKNSDSALGKIAAIGLVKISESAAVAEQAMSNVAEEEVMRLEHRLSYLGTIASVAPMVGLLGTVWGMIDAFSVIALAHAAPDPKKLADGISTALVTTQFGLMIAIPALVLFEVFKTWLAQFVLELNIQIEHILKQFTASAGKSS